MSLNGSLSGITFGGLSSGIDTEGIIGRLIQLEQIPMQKLQRRAQELQGTQGILQTFRTRLQSLNGAASALSNPLAFNPAKASSSASDVATVSATTGAPVGVFNLAVRKLAQAQKISTAAQQDTTTALSKSGTFVVNGKGVKIETSDSLTAIAQKINSANAGVTASIINGGTGRAYLTIASNTAGSDGKIQFADVTGSVLSDLGLATGTAVPREPITNGITSLSFSSTSTKLADLIPNSGITTGSFEINGQSVSVDFSTDTLQSLAAKITSAAGATSTASVRTVTVDGSSRYKLDIVSQQGGDTFSDADGILAALGFLQKPPATELVQAQNAEFSIDGVELTSSTNTITSAIPGATITLLKANSTTPEKTVVTLSRDTDSIRQKIKDFADAYNTTIEFVNQNSQFDKDTFASGPLFGDPVAQQVVDSVSNLLFNQIPGATGNYRNLASIGFGLDDKGKLKLDEAVLTNAINLSGDSLGSLFQTTGTTTGANLTYIFAGSGSRSGTYNVEITAQPTFASYTVGAAQSGATTANELLTFNGSLFGNSPIVLTVPSGSEQSDVLNLINNDSRLNTLIEASVVDGKLKLSSKKAGSVGNFNVTSDQGASGESNLGIGNGTDGLKTAGEDIKGTINGEPATGAPNGMLTGASGNASTAGLQVQYTGNALGLVGTVTIGKGMAAMVTDLMASFTDGANGLLSARDKSLTDQMTDIEDRLTQLQKRLVDKQQELRARFTRMEEAIAKIQQQSLRVSQLNQNAG